MSGRHRFRFFVDGAGSAGAQLPLAAVDARHAQVLRLAEGELVEVVDGSGTAWDARIAPDGLVELVAELEGAGEPAPIHLYAGALTGAKFDELVDAAVQAGAAAITPLVTSRRDGERLGARRARLERIARSAAKQAKRSVVPDVHPPTDAADLPPTGIVVDPGAPEPLARLLAVDPGGDPLNLLVGGADGIAHELVADLVDRGWRRARLGPTILRSELAAPVAVVIATMSLAER